MYANKPPVLGLLDKLRLERGSNDSHIYMVHCSFEETNMRLKGSVFK